MSSGRSVRSMLIISNKFSTKNLLFYHLPVPAEQFWLQTIGSEAMEPSLFLATSDTVQTTKVMPVLLSRQLI